MNLILSLIFMPLVSGLICLSIPVKLTFGKYLAKIISVIITVFLLLISVKLFIDCRNFSNNLFLVDNLNVFLVPAISFFGFLVVLFSLRFIKERESIYFGYVLCSLGASIGAVLSNDTRLLAIFWGFLGLALYILINHNTPDSIEASKKTLIIIGGTDAIMLVGIAILWKLTGSFALPAGKILISGSHLALLAFICLLTASFAKAGVMPFHTWIPDIAEVAPAPVMAFLPASLDKLLGIYLLARVSLNVFELTGSMSFLLMLFGSITIICAVFMAMIQHDFKRLLSYHAVSQVGYMVLGIGTANPVGIAGGIFHMLNNAIYKSNLFLCGGSVEYKTGTSDLDKLGGLIKYMPITFISFLVGALAISGIPPFNGFVSKWMVYQGIVIRIVEHHSIWDVVFLIAAVFGSALTLASFMKLIHAIFLGSSETPRLSTAGEAAGRATDLSEVPWTMWLPTVILSALCLVFGIFAFSIPLNYFIFPIVGKGLNLISFIGLWTPQLATVLILAGIGIGLLIYLVSSLKIREVEPFVGGEEIPVSERVTGVDFYQTVKDMGIFKAIYFLAEKKVFDIYDWGKVIISGSGRFLSSLHSGGLQRYVVWCLVGMLILFFVLLK